jgi:hypothetical protein
LIALLVSRERRNIPTKLYSENLTGRRRLGDVGVNWRENDTKMDLGEVVCEDVDREYIDYLSDC